MKYICPGVEICENPCTHGVRHEKRNACCSDCDEIDGLKCIPVKYRLRNINIEALQKHFESGGTWNAEKGERAKEMEGI